jgi:hypothetical protein
VVAIGAITNVASAILAAPDIAEQRPNHQGTKTPRFRIFSIS